jgi:hypothetical protein
MTDKQTADAARANALAKSIADATKAELASEFAKIAEQSAKLAVSVNAVLTRLETLESAVSSGAAPKRGVRAGPAKSGAGKKPAAKKGAGDDRSKVTNSLLYFRYAMSHDLDDAQLTYGTPENVEEAEKDPMVQKRDKVKDPEGYWSAVAAALWKSTLSDDDKDTIRAQFNTWKEQATRDDADEPLEEEGV